MALFWVAGSSVSDVEKAGTPARKRPPFFGIAAWAVVAKNAGDTAAKSITGFKPEKCPLQMVCLSQFFTHRSRIDLA